MEKAAAGRMWLAPKVRGKPQTGARPVISSKSGKPLKNNPKKLSRSPEVNHSGCSIAEANVAQPFSVGNGHAVGAKVQLSLQVKRQQLRPLRLDDRFILRGNPVLEVDKGIVGHIVGVIDGHEHPRLAPGFVDRR